MTMQIRTKIFTLVGALSLIAMTLAGVGSYGLATLGKGVDDAKAAGTRALYSSRLNQLVTGTVMEARGIYASKDTKDAERFAKGLRDNLDGIDALLKDWEPFVPADEKAMFDRIKQDAASFRA